ncbi:MAG: PilZ domain-containing protein [Bdellovibrionales bacterium]|nr:PilZ domain-containing protein [Bdellovibrionales bacterium]
MYQIGIVSKKQHLLVQVQALLGNDFELNPKVFQTAEALMQHLDRNGIHGLIISFPMFGNSQVKLVSEITQLFPRTPLLVMADVVGPTARRHISAMKKKIFLKDMGRLHEIPGILKKMIRNRNIEVREHERYRAENILSLSSDVQRSSGQLVNIGVGGMMIRSFRSEWKVGDRPIVEVPSSFSGRSRKMSGQIVWTSEDLHHHSRTPSQLVGIQFNS